MPVVAPRATQPLLPENLQSMPRTARKQYTGTQTCWALLALSLLASAPLTSQSKVIDPPPLQFQSERYEVLLVTRRTIGTLTDDNRLSQLITSCSDASGSVEVREGRAA